jgi:hypothetical protein
MKSEDQDEDGENKNTLNTFQIFHSSDLNLDFVHYDDDEDTTYKLLK